MARLRLSDCERKTLNAIRDTRPGELPVAIYHDAAEPRGYILVYGDFPGLEGLDQKPQFNEGPLVAITTYWANLTRIVTLKWPDANIRFVANFCTCCSSVATEFRWDEDAQDMVQLSYEESLAIAA